MRRLAYLCRDDHATALWVIAYLTQGVDGEVLSNVLDGAEEMHDSNWIRPFSHIQAFTERFGRAPGR